MASAGLPELSIIIPCLNEEENVADILKSVNEVVVANGLNVETILIDDLSDDRTFEVALAQAPTYPALRLQVVRRYHARRGYGAVVRYGIAHAVGKFLVMVSADGVDPLEVLPKLLDEARAGASIAQCSRYLNEGDRDNLPWKYKVSHFFYRSLVRHLLGLRMHDSTYSFRVVGRVEVLALGLTQNSFSISPEMFFKIFLNGGRIAYVGRGQGVRTKGTSKFRFRREGIRYGYVLVRAWLHRLEVALWF